MMRYRDAVRPGRHGSARSRPAGASRRRRTPYQSFRVVALILVVVVLVAPLVWMLSASFKTNVDIYDTSKTIFFSPTLDNYDEGAASRPTTSIFIFNSFWVAFVSTTLSLLLGVPAAYAMSRFTMQRSALVVLMARVIPGVAPARALVLRLLQPADGRRLQRADPQPHVRGAAADRLHHDGFFDSLPLELEEAALRSTG